MRLEELTRRWTQKVNLAVHALVLSLVAHTADTQGIHWHNTPSIHNQTKTESSRRKGTVQYFVIDSEEVILALLWCTESGWLQAC